MCFFAPSNDIFPMQTVASTAFAKNTNPTVRLVFFSAFAAAVKVGLSLPPPMPAPTEDPSPQPLLRSSCLCPLILTELCEICFCKLSPLLLFSSTQTLTHREQFLYTTHSKNIFLNSLSWLLTTILKGNLANPNAKQQQWWVATPSMTSVGYTCDLFCFLSWCHNTSSLERGWYWVMEDDKIRGAPASQHPCRRDPCSAGGWAVSIPTCLSCSLSRADLGTTTPPFIICFQIPVHSVPSSTPSTPSVCHLPGIFSLLSTLHSHSSPTHSVNKSGESRAGVEGELAGEEKGFYR